ncbi:MAG: hypothetical protein QCH31_11365 [Methanolobus sp.]|nr:hypothetical protein [Methanolobus sp.]
MPDVSFYRLHAREAGRSGIMPGTKACFYDHFHLAVLIQNISFENIRL